MIQYQMNISFPLQQIQKTSNLDANILSRQNKLNLMAADATFQIRFLRKVK